MAETKTPDQAKDDRSANPPNSQPGSGQEAGSSEESNPKDQTSQPAGQGGDQGTETQSPFTHESLRKYRTPQEVERYVAMLEETTRDQGRELTRLATSQQATPPNREQPRDDLPTNDDYWRDPIGTNQKLFGKMLEEAITPFRQDLMRGQVQSTRERLRSELKYFGTLEPTIDTLLSKQGILGKETEDTLRFVYKAVVGELAEQGRLPDIGGGERREEAPANSQPGWAPPQHRPSGAPLPESSGGKPKKRELTESERRIAREMGKSDEQYLAWLETEPSQVLTAERGGK